MNTEVVTPRIVPCSPVCGCAYCVVERSGGETLRTAARKFLDVWDSYVADDETIESLVQSLREQVR